MSGRLRKATSNVDKSESNQCVLLHLVAGVMWNRGGRKLGIPELSKILLETEEWRMAEVLQATHALQHCEGIDNVFAQELLSLSHDVLSTGHDRDYRSISVFLNEHLGEEDVGVRIFDIRPRAEGGYVLLINVFPDSTEPSKNFVDLVAFKHHMRWLKPCLGAFSSASRDWELHFKDHIRRFHLGGWKGKLSHVKGDEESLGVNPCLFCTQEVKTNLTPPGFYDYFAHGRHFCHGCDIPPDRCGDGEDGSYPILNNDWRTPAAVDPLAYDYLEIVKQPYSHAAVLDALVIGERMVSKFHDVRLVARQIQEIVMRSNAPLVENAKTFLSFNPTLSNRAADLHERGDMPCYHGEEPSGPRSSGLPYEDSKTELMVQKMRKDVNKGRILMVPSELVDRYVKVIPTPTTTAPEKMPDRALSEDVRIISDLRLPNLFCTKSDFPEITITDLRAIAERVISLRRTWPHIPSKCCKRDIDSAYKRIRVHPDMSIILCTEFHLKHFGGDGTFYMMYPTLPFGWRGSPSYFSVVGEGLSEAPENIYFTRQDEGWSPKLEFAAIR